MTLQGILTLALFAWYFISNYIEGKKKYKEQKEKAEKQYQEQKKILQEQREKDRENIYKAIQDLGEKLKS